MFASRLSYLASLGYAFTFRKTIHEDVIQIEVYKDGRHAEERIDRRNIKDAGLDVETFFDYVLLNLASLVDGRIVAEGGAEGVAKTDSDSITVCVKEGEQGL